MTSVQNETSSENGANGKKISVFRKIRTWLHSPGCKCCALIILALILVCSVFLGACSPKKYDFSVGSISHDTINAPKDVVDEVTTEDRKTAAANAVEPTYRFQEGVKEEVLLSLASVFSELRTVQQYGLTLREEGDTARTTFTEEETDYALNLLHLVSYYRYQITTLLRTDTAVFDDMVTTVTTAVANSLNTTIREGQVSQSIQTILQIVGYRMDVSLMQNIIPTVLRTCIKPNMVIDQEATDIARQKARDNVEPIVYLQGQNIIREGDRITRSQLAMLRALGLLSDDAYDYSVYIGALVLIVLSFTVMLIMLRMLVAGILTDPKRLTVLLIVFCLSVLLADMSRLLPSLYILPIAFAPILVCVLIQYRAAWSISVPLAMLYAGFAVIGSNYSFYDVVIITLMTLTSGTVSIAFLKGRPQRIRALLAGPLAAPFCFACLAAVKYLASAESVSLLTVGIWSLAGNLLSGILAFALQPLFESLFTLPTPSRLMDLTNPNQPVLRRLMIEAPGTYHHSIVVANLAEAAATRIGANSYLARAGAYYHDIGKLKRPGYFKENQMGENPHDKTDPYISAAILTSHVKDGVLLAQKERLPVEVQDIIQQSHGDTPVMFFYHKALQMSNGNPVDIREFRYEGPRPQTKEAAVVMLADTIEAAVRSMKDPTPKAINQFIERLVRGRLEDGQLSDSPLTLQDIDQICDAFSNILMGVFHERIEYPTVLHTVATNIQNPPASPDMSEGKKDPAGSEAGSPESRDGQGSAFPDTVHGQEAEQQAEGDINDH